MSQDFVLLWLSEVLNYSPKETSSKQRVKQCTDDRVLERFTSIFEIKKPSPSRDSKFAFRPVSANSFFNGPEAVVQVLGVIFIVDGKKQLQNYVPFLIDFSVCLEQSKYRLVGFGMTLDAEQSVSNLLSANERIENLGGVEATDANVDALAQTWLGEQQYKNGFPEAAAQTLRLAQKVNPKLCRAYGMRGLILCELGDVNAGLEDCTKAVKIEPTNPANYVFRALAKSSAGDHLGAIADNQRALSIDQNYATAVNNLGIQFSKLGSFKKAIDLFTKAIKLKDGDPLYHFNLAETFEATGWTEAAIVCYSEAIQRKSDYLEAFTRRCEMREDLGDLKGALSDACAVVRLNPLDPEAYDLRGRIRDKLGDWGRARKDYAIAIELAPHCVVAYADRAFSFLRTMEPEKALPDAEIAVRHCPQRLTLYGLRGIVLLGMRRFTDAIPDLKVCVAAYPNVSHYQILLGEALAGAGHLEEALDTLQKAQEITSGPEHAFVLHLKSTVLSRLSRHEETASDLDQLIKLYPRWPEPYFARARARTFAGNSAAGQDFVQGAELWLRRLAGRCGIQY